jgi:transcriptional regulator with XRE-family HTH domain
MEQNFNKHLGNKLRLRRLALGLTQTKVAKAINVTFQQIQKYEKGANGVSSIRLMQLSNFLKVPIVYFFEDYKGYQNEISSESLNIEENINYAFLARMFSSVSNQQKDKLIEILKNTRSLEKTG